MRRAEPDAGFSLLELLVSLSLLGLITVFAVGGVRLGARVWQAQTASEDAGDIELLSHHLRRWLEAAHPFQSVVDGERGPIGFVGEKDRMVFVITEDGRGDRPGLFQYELHLADGAAHEAFGRAGDPQHAPALVLTRRRMAEAGLFTAAGEEDEHLLSSAITSIAFSYFGRDIGETEAGWRQQWRDMARLPRLVRIELALRSGPTPLRELVVAVRAGG